MSAPRASAILIILALVFLAPAVKGQQPGEHQHQHEMDAAQEPDKHVEHGAVKSMSPGHHRMGPHMKMTAPRP